MEAEYVNLFIMSICRIMEATCMINFKAGEPISKKNGYLPDSSIVRIDFFSGLTGGLVLNISHDTALGIISNMVKKMDGMIDELGQSAFCELGNIMAGNAVTICANNNNNIVYITPPVYCTGEQYQDDDREMLSIPFFSEIGSFSVNIFFDV